MHGRQCGFYGDSTRECRCTPGQIQQYLGKISDPLLDRIDIHVEVPAVPYKELRGSSQAEPSAEIRGRVDAARALQQVRGYYNSRMPSRMIRKQCALGDAGERTLEMAVRKMGLSARAHDRILKVARTVADLGHSETVSAKHVAEACSIAVWTAITEHNSRGTSSLLSLATDQRYAERPEITYEIRHLPPQ
jgi:magnesium chelatase family protein